MRIAYFDCFAGIAGDMVVGALLDAGLDVDILSAELSKLGMHDEFRIRSRRVMRHAISGTKFDVLRPDSDDAVDGGADNDHDGSDHGHDHRHEHDHNQSDHHAHARDHRHGGETPHAHRGLADVVGIIESAKLARGVTDRAIAIFRRLAEAEAAMHDSTPDEVRFHEVGAVDAIVDIVGACIGIDALGIDEVYASPVRVGRGTVRTAHGVLPVPAPGTLELLKGVPVEHTDLQSELVTPTGAAIITEVAETFGQPPAFVPESVGYGAGGRDSREIANLLRVEIGESGLSLQHDRVVMLETNLDDMTAEVCGYLMESLLAAGARDVYFDQVIMKKNRPGVVVHVLADAETRDRLTNILFRETPTLGVRMTDMARRTLPRESGSVDTPWGAVRVKRAYLDGGVRVTPEYDDCAAIARDRGVPILDVYDAVRRASDGDSAGA